MTDKFDQLQEKIELCAEVREDIRIAKRLGTGVDLRALENTAFDLEREIGRESREAYSHLDFYAELDARMRVIVRLHPRMGESLFAASLANSAIGAMLYRSPHYRENRI